MTLLDLQLRRLHRARCRFRAAERATRTGIAASRRPAASADQLAKASAFASRCHFTALRLETEGRIILEGGRV